ncbi:hypothetical protein DL89DRAFT_257895 [Linderina pennispora]|uniref:Uncharacterized protein n=1 Tax=Linderina pennispora TaxID=61395 RepID=A0A1Y1W7Z7_9FUNG|nr:uncharacterized protein DL89DRAFT_257895 [Linderina pennispora]ORX69663.1 hypothetical protein DL89DRAFT_257895 [Linderina pennispora]
MSAATVVRVPPRFSTHQATYLLDPLQGPPQRLNPDAPTHASDEAKYIAVSVLMHNGGAKPGMVWAWAAVTASPSRPGAMANLSLSLPPNRPGARGNSSQLLGNGLDDPTPDVARRLATRFRRPVYLALEGVAASRLIRATDSLDMAMSQESEVAGVEMCLVRELKQALEQ